jgi:hypothetical protein
MADGNPEPDVPDMPIGFDEPGIPPVEPGIPVGAETPAGDPMPSPADLPGEVTSVGDDSIPVLSDAPLEAAMEGDVGIAPEVDMLDPDVPVRADARADAGEFDGKIANGAVKEFGLTPAATVGGVAELDVGVVGCTLAANCTALVDIFAASVPRMAMATTARAAPKR